MPVVVFHILPLKLYGVLCNPAHVSVAPVIKSVPVTHSFHALLLNVNVGGMISICIVAADATVV